MYFPYSDTVDLELQVGSVHDGVGIVFNSIGLILASPPSDEETFQIPTFHAFCVDLRNSNRVGMQR